MGCDHNGDHNDDSNTSSLNGIISGTATKGPVADAVVTAFSVHMDGTKGDRIGTGQTDAQGDFNMPVSDYSGPVLIEMTGGHYIDEATGQEMDVLPGSVMTCTPPFMESGTTFYGVQITPLTSMAQQMAANMPGGMIEANIAESQQAVGDFIEFVNSPMNQSGVTLQDMQALFDKLEGSGGSILP